MTTEYIVIKIGGVASKQLTPEILAKLSEWQQAGQKIVIVHGGGFAINQLMEENHIPIHKVNGLRVTDEPTMEIAEMVLNRVNKSLVQLVSDLGIRAVGISGKDGNLLECEKKLSKGEDIGFVGEITKVNPQLIDDLIEKDFLPIICPIGYDNECHSYNINADDAACAIAKAVGAEKLAFLTDVEGIYRDFSDKSSLISEMTVEEARKFIQSDGIGGGMIPKLTNCIDALESGVSRVHILDGRIAHCLLLEIFTNKGIGTAILREREDN